MRHAIRDPAIRRLGAWPLAELFIFVDAPASTKRLWVDRVLRHRPVATSRPDLMALLPLPSVGSSVHVTS